MLPGTTSRPIPLIVRDKITQGASMPIPNAWPVKNVEPLTRAMINIVWNRLHLTLVPKTGNSVFATMQREEEEWFVNVRPRTDHDGRNNVQLSNAVCDRLRAEAAARPSLRTGLLWVWRSLDARDDFIHYWLIDLQKLNALRLPEENTSRNVKIGENDQARWRWWSERLGMGEARDIHDCHHLIEMRNDEWEHLQHA
jgi:hypothetical protein